jgi:putative flippase GtrA
MKLSKDYSVAALAGFLTGLCAIPTLLNLHYQNTLTLIVLPFALALLWAVGFWVGQALSRMIPVMLQLSKFAEVGVLNTAINFGFLNLASLATGVTAGLAVGGFNIPGTLLAASNSYIWNKQWVFKKIDNKGFFNDIPKFAIVTFFGLIVNSLIIVLFTSYLHPALGLSNVAWLNIGKALATLIGFLVDFLGYKFIVFRIPTSGPNLQKLA